MKSFSITVLVSLLICSRVAADKPAVARTVHYSGNVQGVGFRLATVRIARDYPVTGWVKNLKDGRVQLVVEGPEESVERFLKAVREFWKDNIEKEAIEKQPPSGKHKTFEMAD